MKKNYVIDDVYRDFKENNAGFKAREDVNNILADNYELAYLLKGKNKVLRFINYLNIICKIKIFSNVVVIQYPFYVNKTYINLMRFWVPKRTILLIHDIDSLRNNLSLEEVLKEISIFNRFSYIISHNQKMTKWLKDNGCTSKIVNLEIFDYLVNETIPVKDSRENVVAFAGNLSKEKSGFLYKNVLKNDHLNIYGPNFDEEFSHSLNYKGSFPAEQLPRVLDEKYGLIWDGDSPEKCIGHFGEYLKYNNPHKTSLYLVSGLPIIIWNEAAISQFIEKNNLGFSIASISEINEKISSISDEEYKLIQSNVRQVSKRLQSGYYLKKAINKCLEDMK